MPIRTDRGWLCLYHGVDRTCNGFIYRLGVMLFDLDDPSKILARSPQPVPTPTPKIIHRHSTNLTK